MKTSANFNMALPEGADSVLVDVLTDALTKLDTGARVVAGTGVNVTTNATTKVQTVAVAPQTTLNVATTTNAPSSKAVADYVTGIMSGVGSYQGQFDYYGTLAQIRATTDTNKTGIYLNAGVVYKITRTTGAWPAAGTVHTSQVSGDTYDIVNLLDKPATGGGYESGSMRYVREATVANSYFAITGGSKAVKSVTASAPLVVNSTDPFNPALSLTFGAVGSGNTTMPVTGAAVNTAVSAKQNTLSGTSGSAVLFTGTAGSVTSRAISSVPTASSTSLITSGGVYSALQTLESENWTISFAATQPTAIAGEKILWLSV